MSLLCSHPWLLPSALLLHFLKPFTSTGICCARPALLHLWAKSEAAISLEQLQATIVAEPIQSYIYLYSPLESGLARYKHVDRI
jgi:hypothetical protein